MRGGEAYQPIFKNEVLALSKETILVVDDGLENRTFVVDYILEPNGYKSITAKDGQEGFRLAVEHQPDLILLDLQMPRMDGREVLQALAERGLDIPVVLMTFHGSEEIAVEMYRLGAKDYVKKPYSVDEMLVAIERNLGEARLRLEKEALTARILHANQELQRRVQELKILYRIGKSVTSTIDMNLLLPQIVDAAVQIVDAAAGELYLVRQKKLVCRAQKTQNNARAQTVDHRATNPMALHVAKTGKSFVATQKQLQKLENAPSSAAYTPLIIRKKVIGVLGVSNYVSNAEGFDKNKAALLSALADYAAIALENSQNVTAIRVQGQQQREEIRGTFERFVPPTVVERALSNPEDLQLGGTRQQVTILFADIRGYTAWSEQESPERVVEMLNRYLSLAAELVMSWEGTLDKFFGDGLMAIFNAPEEQPHHVHRATDAGLALLRAAEDLNQRYGYGLNYSVGVNTGEAVVGYIGTERAMNYTAIGDVVNLAKRLQESAPPGQILAEKAVIDQLGAHADAKQIGELKVRNRQEPAVAYRINGLRPLS